MLYDWFRVIWNAILEERRLAEQLLICKAIFIAYRKNSVDLSADCRVYNTFPFGEIIKGVSEGATDEKDISTQQYFQKENSRISGPDGYKERKACHKASPG